MSDRAATLAYEKALDRLNEHRRTNRLEAYKPYAKQREFHDHGKAKRERLFRAGNQLGKCATVRSLIDTPDGTVPLAALVTRARPFAVLAWDGDRQVAAWASAPFRKPGLHHCYRVTMADGQWIEAADCHLVLTFGGWRWISGCLPQFGLGRQASMQEVAPSARAEDAQDWSGTPSGCRDDCSRDCRRYGGPPRCEADSRLTWPPSQADAQPHIPPSSRWDVRLRGRTSIGQGDTARHASSGALLDLADPSAGFEGQAACTTAQSWLRGRRGGAPLRHASASPPLSFAEEWLHVRHETVHETYGPCDVVTPIDGNHIVAVEYIGRNEVYDFEVYGWHNYTAGGLVNHNTLAGAAEVAYHLTGEYPLDWQGRRWERATKWWAGSKSGEATRGGVQRLLVGEPSDPSAMGTGFIPRRCIVDTSPARGLADALDTVTVKHIAGGNSTLKFKSYEQGRERWQVETVDGVWMDEEPPSDIYTEALSRTNATKGLVFVTFTPLLGVSDVVMRFIKEAHPDRSDTVMTIDDVEHISPEERAKIIASYPEHEREARTRGVPILGSGRIFPVPRDAIAVDAFDIPEWWPVIGALDFGWDHPTAAVKLAHDRDADTIYVTQAYRVSKGEVHTHAAALKPWGEIPWSWPHDGLNSTAGAPDPLANLYRKQGLKMRPDPSSYDDTRRNAVEAGLMDMLDRMTTGRFKVFRHLNDWFEEFELYHRKDGRVVKERDDLMSATRYGLMDIRFATAKAEKHAHERYRRYRGGQTSNTGWAA